MRRNAILSALSLCLGLSCVTTDVQEPVATPLPLDQYKPLDLPPRSLAAPSQPRSAARPSTPASRWLPAGGRISPRWSTIVIHHSATDRGGAKSFDKYHREVNGWDELGYHFVIGNGTDTPDGFVEVGARWLKQKHGAHCKTPGNYFNEHGIGICLVGDFTRRPPTPRQLASLSQLVHFLCDRCRIAPDRVTTHHAVNSKTQCPGPHFQLSGLRRSLTSVAAARSGR